MRLEEIAPEDVQVGMRVAGAIRGGRVLGYYPQIRTVAHVGCIRDNGEVVGIAITYVDCYTQYYYPLASCTRLLVLVED